MSKYGHAPAFARLTRNAAALERGTGRIRSRWRLSLQRANAGLNQAAQERERAGRRSKRSSGETGLPRQTLDSKIANHGIDKRRFRRRKWL
jgi:hypothetical protein